MGELCPVGSIGASSRVSTGFQYWYGMYLMYTFLQHVHFQCVFNTDQDFRRVMKYIQAVNFRGPLYPPVLFSRPRWCFWDKIQPAVVAIKRKNGTDRPRIASVSQVEKWGMKYIYTPVQYLVRLAVAPEFGCHVSAQIQFAGAV